MTPGVSGPGATVFLPPGATHYAPLFNAARAGMIMFAPVRARKHRHTLPGASDLPTVLLVLDDDERPTGPAGWRDATRLMKWARYVVVHGTGAQAWPYDNAVALAPSVGRLLIIETCSTMVPAWRRAMGTLPGIQITPPPGAVHPVAEPAPTVH